MNKSFMKKNGKRVIKTFGKNIMQSSNKNLEQTAQNSKTISRFRGVPSKSVFAFDTESYKNMQPVQNFLNNTNNFHEQVCVVDKIVKPFDKNKQYLIQGFRHAPEVQEQLPNPLHGLGLKSVLEQVKNTNEITQKLAQTFINIDEPQEILGRSLWGQDKKKWPVTFIVDMENWFKKRYSELKGVGVKTSNTNFSLKNKQPLINQTRPTEEICLRSSNNKKSVAYRSKTNYEIRQQVVQKPIKIDKIQEIAGRSIWGTDKKKWPATAIIDMETWFEKRYSQLKRVGIKNYSTKIDKFQEILGRALWGPVQKTWPSTAIADMNTWFVKRYSKLNVKGVKNSNAIFSLKNKFSWKRDTTSGSQSDNRQWPAKQARLQHNTDKKNVAQSLKMNYQTTEQLAQNLITVGKTQEIVGRSLWGPDKEKWPVTAAVDAENWLEKYYRQSNKADLKNSSNKIDKFQKMLGRSLWGPVQKKWPTTSVADMNTWFVKHYTQLKGVCVINAKSVLQSPKIDFKSKQQVAQNLIKIDEVQEIAGRSLWGSDKKKWPVTAIADIRNWCEKRYRQLNIRGAKNFTIKIDKFQEMLGCSLWGPVQKKWPTTSTVDMNIWFLKRYNQLKKLGVINGKIVSQIPKIDYISKQQVVQNPIKIDKIQEMAGRSLWGSDKKKWPVTAIADIRNWFENRYKQLNLVCVKSSRTEIDKFQEILGCSLWGPVQKKWPTTAIVDMNTWFVKRYNKLKKLGVLNEKNVSQISKSDYISKQQVEQNPIKTDKIQEIAGRSLWGSDKKKWPVTAIDDIRNWLEKRYRQLNTKGVKNCNTKIDKFQEILGCSLWGPVKKKWPTTAIVDMNTLFVTHYNQLKKLGVINETNVAQSLKTDYANKKQVGKVQEIVGCFLWGPDKKKWPVTAIFDIRIWFEKRYRELNIVGITNSYPQIDKFQEMLGCSLWGPDKKKWPTTAAVDMDSWVVKSYKQLKKSGAINKKNMPQSSKIDYKGKQQVAQNLIKINKVQEIAGRSLWGPDKKKWPTTAVADVEKWLEKRYSQLNAIGVKNSNTKIDKFQEMLGRSLWGPVQKRWPTTAIVDLNDWFVKQYNELKEQGVVNAKSVLQSPKINFESRQQVAQNLIKIDKVQEIAGRSLWGPDKKKWPVTAVSDIKSWLEKRYRQLNAVGVKNSNTKIDKFQEMVGRSLWGPVQKRWPTNAISDINNWFVKHYNQLKEQSVVNAKNVRQSPKIDLESRQQVAQNLIKIDKIQEIAGRSLWGPDKKKWPVTAFADIKSWLEKRYRQLNAVGVKNSNTKIDKFQEMVGRSLWGPVQKRWPTNAISDINNWFVKHYNQLKEQSVVNAKSVRQSPKIDLESRQQVAQNLIKIVKIQEIAGRSLWGPDKKKWPVTAFADIETWLKNRYKKLNTVSAKSSKPVPRLKNNASRKNYVTSVIQNKIKQQSIQKLIKIDKFQEMLGCSLWGPVKKRWPATANFDMKKWFIKRYTQINASRVIRGNVTTDFNKKGLMVPNQVVRNFIKRYERKNVSISKAFYMYLTSVYGRQSQLGWSTSFNTTFKKLPNSFFLSIYPTLASLVSKKKVESITSSSKEFKNLYTDKEQNGFDYNNKKVALLQKKFFSNKNSVVFRKKLRLTMAGRSKILRFKYNISDRLSILYTAMFKIPTHTYKIFSMLELQLCSLAVRGRLVPYTFMVYELCFYRIFFVNQKTISDSFYVLGLYDTLQIPVFLYRYFFYKHLGFQFLPEVLMQFFKKYWDLLTAFQHNKLWTASSFLLSPAEAKIIIFAYPSVLTYLDPFRRFSKLFFKNQAFDYVGHGNFFFYTHSVIKLRIFSYGWFYK